VVQCYTKVEKIYLMGNNSFIVSITSECDLVTLPKAKVMSQLFRVHWPLILVLANPTIATRPRHCLRVVAEIILLIQFEIPIELA